MDKFLNREAMKQLEASEIVRGILVQIQKYLSII